MKISIGISDNATVLHGFDKALLKAFLVLTVISHNRILSYVGFRCTFSPVLYIIFLCNKLRTLMLQCVVINYPNK